MAGSLAKSSKIVCDYTVSQWLLFLIRLHVIVMMRILLNCSI